MGDAVGAKIQVTSSDGFEAVFIAATGNRPFAFQRAFAESGQIHSLVDVPTGLGKTAMAVLGWLWRRRFAPDPVRRGTPRRLVYCLPMRVLVEQTRDNAIEWLDHLDLLAARGKDCKGLAPAGACVMRHPPTDDEVKRDRRGLFVREESGKAVEPYEPPATAQWIESPEEKRIAVYVLMGGEDEPKWDVHPERDAIIIGTQDMLLSRALNRGYAASRARWPMHFGLLNTDCLWLFDEIQLMGSGLATTAQLEAFRRQLTPNPASGNGGNGPEGNGCKSVWMSATLRPDWLRTVDFKGRIDDQGRIDGETTLSLSEAEKNNNDEINRRWNAKKPLSRATAAMREKDAIALEKEVRTAHKSGTRTIVVVNTVKRACALIDELSKGNVPPKSRKVGGKKAAETSATTAATSAACPPTTPKLVLLHSLFRPPDRADRISEALAEVDQNGAGTIIVSTQVIEAGVDVSATTLFTELAPWTSLVQRFGRCNRRGELNDAASVHWINLPAEDTAAEKLRHPYELADLRAAADELAALEDVGPGSLDAHRKRLSEEKLEALFPHRHTHVIRRKDMLDLFDTTPDLAGNDIDINRYVREVEETDVRVFWRDYGDPDSKSQGATPNDINGRGRAGGTHRVEPAPLRDELCPVPIGDFRSFAEKHRGRTWRWNFTENKWEQPDPNAIAPGQVFLVHAGVGGYSAERGWSGEAKDIPSLDHAPTQDSPNDAEGYEDDSGSHTAVWQVIAEHTQDVCVEADRLLKMLDLPAGMAEAVRLAARWHDWGKAHVVFQKAVKDDGRPKDRETVRTIAKAPSEFWQGYARRHFRHELASALAVLQRPHESLKTLSDDELNLVAYLIAAHHGKVRLSIRSMPNEVGPRADAGVPQPGKRFARGVWDGDVLASVDLRGEVVAPVVTLSLEPMELGLCEGRPVECFKDQPSWVERVLRLRDTLGPFRLAYLEALVRAADERASAGAEKAMQQPASAEVDHV